MVEVDAKPRLDTKRPVRRKVEWSREVDAVCFLEYRRKVDDVGSLKGSRFDEYFDSRFRVAGKHPSHFLLCEAITDGRYAATLHGVPHRCQPIEGFNEVRKTHTLRLEVQLLPRVQESKHCLVDHSIKMLPT